mgnify:CR=1 FL=1
MIDQLCLHWFVCNVNLLARKGLWATVITRIRTTILSAFCSLRYFFVTRYLQPIRYILFHNRQFGIAYYNVKHQTGISRIHHEYLYGVRTQGVNVWLETRLGLPKAFSNCLLFEKNRYNIPVTSQSKSGCDVINCRSVKLIQM